MNRPDSDIDLFIVYQAPSTDFLIGKAHIGSHRSQVGNVDRVSFELGHTVVQLLKNNINFLWGVMSPIVIKSWNHLEELRSLTKMNLSKELYHSVHGLGLHNYKKYVESGKDPTQKRCTIICRSLRFGIRLLSNAEFDFSPIKPCDPKDVITYLDALDIANAQSKLPLNPEHSKEMYEWLLQIRLEELKT